MVFFKEESFRCWLWQVAHVAARLRVCNCRLASFFCATIDGELVSVDGSAKTSIGLKSPMNEMLTISDLALNVCIKNYKIRDVLNYKHSPWQPSSRTPKDLSKSTILVLPVSRTIRMISTSPRIFLLMSAPLAAKYFTTSS